MWADRVAQGRDRRGAQAVQQAQERECGAAAEGRARQRLFGRTGVT